MRAILRHPGTSVATSGRPQAAASSRLKGNPSRWDGRTAICAHAQSASMSLTKPRCLTLGRLVQASISCGGIDVGLAGSGRPAMMSWMSRPRWMRRSCAANSVRIPFDPTKRPTNAMVIGPAGSGEATIAPISTPDPGMSAIRSRLTPSRSITARSSGFCTSTAARERFSRDRSASLNGARATRTLAVASMNIVPRPVRALRQTTGKPVAASDPTTAAGSATWWARSGLSLR